MGKQESTSARPGYSNFQDPTGLLLRMLKSRNKVAYFTLFREGLSLLLTPLDKILAPFEKRKLDKGLQSALPIILVVGGSRSGTTLVYQTLCAYLPVSYFTNLMAAFPSAPIISSSIFHNFNRKRKTNFKNYFGSISGFKGPNDAFQIWNRWFGSDRNQVPETISRSTLNDLGNFVNTWNYSQKKPLLNKNNRNSFCIEYFESALPNRCYYVYVKRNPVYVVQSLIKSREMIQGTRDVPWGLGSSNIENGMNGNPNRTIQSICQQVLEVEKRIEKSLRTVPDNRCYRFTYESFCDRPISIIKDIHQLIFDEPLLISDSEINIFRNTNIKKLSDEEFNIIKQHISQEEE